MLRWIPLTMMAPVVYCCCYGGPPANNAAAVFTDLTVTGTCLGCGPQVYKRTNAEVYFNVGSWSRKDTYYSNSITMAGVAVNDVCAISPYGQLMIPGYERGHALSCYVSAANTVKAIMSIGVKSIATSKMDNNFQANIAVIGSGCS